MTELILFVDDDPAVLAGIARNFRPEALRREHPHLPPLEIRTLTDGQLAIDLLRSGTPVAVLIADLRMPGIDGVQLLEEARRCAPGTTRLLLTGDGDITTAADAVNRGAVFRFLTKPCPREALLAAVEAALLQYRHLRSERELLDQTLAGTIRVLTEVLALVNPIAASRALRIRRIAGHLVERLGLADGWEIEVAALLSQLGHLTLGLAGPEEGTVASLEARKRLLAHPAAGRDLLASIPRLEGVAAIVGAQHDPCDAADVRVPIPERDRVRLGGQVLCVAGAFDSRLCGGLASDEALERLRLEPSRYDPAVVEALADLEMPALAYIPRRVTVSDLRSGMVLDQDVRNESGLLLITKGNEVTLPVLIRLKTLVASGAIGTQLQVLARAD